MERRSTLAPAQDDRSCLVRASKVLTPTQLCFMDLYVQEEFHRKIQSSPVS